MPGKTTVYFLFILTWLLGSCREPAIPGSAGRSYAKMDCYFFFIPDCPACKSSFAKILLLKEKYSEAGLKITAVYSDALPDRTLLDQTLKAYTFDLPLIYDSTLTMAKKFDVSVTPQCVLLDSTGKTVYSGRIDNYYYALGKHRNIVTEHYLEEAIRSLITGKLITIPHTTPLGCKIFLPGQEK
jgi:thiol-disulfide isomerase/thioredoxin